MSQQTDPTDAITPTVIPTPLVPIAETLNKLIQEVHDLPVGGDLEGLIESHLAGLERQCMDLALDQRQRAAEQHASEPLEVSPPSGLPEVPSHSAARAQEAADDSDPTR